MPLSPPPRKPVVKTVLVMGLTACVENAHLREIFEYFGDVESVETHTASVSEEAESASNAQQTRGMFRTRQFRAFIEFRTERDALDAIEGMNGGVIDGNKVNVVMLTESQNDMRSRRKIAQDTTLPRSAIHPDHNGFNNDRDRNDRYQDRHRERERFRASPPPPRDEGRDGRDRGLANRGRGDLNGRLKDRASGPFNGYGESSESTIRKHIDRDRRDGREDDSARSFRRNITDQRKDSLSPPSNSQGPDAIRREYAISTRSRTRSPPARHQS
eukprot:jgi/Hompol1/3915/HPOL_006820-RA